MLALGVEISRDLQLWITVLTIVIMIGGLTPKFWKRHNTAKAIETARVHPFRWTMRHLLMQSHDDDIVTVSLNDLLRDK